MTDEVLVRAEASVGRLGLAIALQATLGVMLIYIAITEPPALQWQVFLVILGGLCLFLAERTYAARLVSLELTKEGLRDSTGTVVAALDDIKTISRGTFAAKPSQGFTLVLKTKSPARWLPGLWWRAGRRIGIGGVTPGSQTKVMAQILESLLIAKLTEELDQAG